MKTALSIAIITLLLIPSSLFSQNKRYLEKKAFYNEKGKGNLMIFPTVSEDISKLSVSAFLTENESGQMRMSFSGKILNLTNGRVERDLEGLQAYFIKNDLFVNDMSELSGNWYSALKIVKLMEKTPYYIINLETSETTDFNMPKGELFTGADKGYITTMKVMEESVALYEQNNNSLTKRGVYSLYMGSISHSGDEIYGSSIDNKQIRIFDIQTGRLNYSLQLANAPIQVHLTKNNKIIYNEYSYLNGINSCNIIIRDRLTNQITASLSTGETGTVHFRCNEEGNELITVNQQTGIIKFWAVPSGELLAETSGSYYKPGGSKTKTATVYNLDPKGNYYVISYSNGIISLFSSEERKIIADIFIDGTDWAVIARDGRADGTEEAFKKLEWQEYDASGKLVNTTSLDATLSNFYYPRLLYSILNEESGSEELIEEQIDNTPTVKILNIENNDIIKDIELELKVKAGIQEDPLKEILVFLNGKLINPEEIESEQSGKEITKTLKIELLTGNNYIKCIARTEKNFESESDEVVVFYKGMKKTTDLYMLVIGIDNYKNPRYNLNYAIADAKAVKEKIEDGCSSIFNSYEFTFLSDASASKEKITEAFNTIIEKAEASDVFVFYYAGHGVMSEEQKSEFYIIPYEVTQLYGDNDQLKTNGISAEELKEFSKKLRAQKQLFIFDACQSGGIVDKLAARGIAEERAIAQLARSTGTFWLTASNSEQYATEFSELGHGLFTYTILKGLSGDADGSNSDKKITVKEISAYLNDMVPQLSKKYKGMPQYPTSYGYGQDFPVIVIK